MSPRVCLISQKRKLVFPYNPRVTQSKRDILPCLGTFNLNRDRACRFSGNLRTSEEGADTVIWLALQPKEKLVSGGFYFDRAEAPKHLPFTATKGSHSAIDSIIVKLHSMANL